MRRLATKDTLFPGITQGFGIPSDFNSAHALTSPLTLPPGPQSGWILRRFLFHESWFGTLVLLMKAVAGRRRLKIGKHQQNPPPQVVLRRTDRVFLTVTDLNRCQNLIGFNTSGRLVPCRRWDILQMNTRLRPATRTGYTRGIYNVRTDAKLPTGALSWPAHKDENLVPFKHPLWGG